MNVQQLISKLNKMVAEGDINPESEIIIAHYAGEEKELVKDLYFWGVDWLWSDPVDEDDTEKLLVLEGYDVPMRKK